MTDTLATTPEKPEQNEALAYGLLFVLPAMFATNMLVAKGMVGLFPPVSLAFWRWTLTLGVMSLLCLPSLIKYRHVFLEEWKEFLVLGSLGMGVCGAFVYLGALTTTATNVGIIYASSPVFIVLLSALFFGERLRPIQLGGVFISLIGVLSIIIEADLNVLLTLNFVEGDLWILGASMGWAVYSVLQKNRPSKLPLLPRICGITVGGLVSLLPFTLMEMIDGQFPILNQQTLINMGLLVFVASLGAYLTHSFIMRSLGASRAGLVLYLSPIYNSVLAWYLLGESLSWYHYSGAAMVLFGIFLTSIKPRRLKSQTT